ncbi:hypothetical protein Hanom_Chr13g01242601 [Helianthus anomalus]
MPVAPERPPTRVSGTPAAREVAAATEPNQERIREASSSPDSEELFEDNDVSVLMMRITALEKDKIFKDVQMASLME